MTFTPPLCPYCHGAAELVQGDVVYPGRAALAQKFFWRCQPCDAWVGTHSNSKDHAPLGRLADAELRAAKIRAHAAFDRTWKARHETGQITRSKAKHRRAGYNWLARQMGLTVAQCHIGMFDVEQCNRVVTVCTPSFAKVAP